MKKIAIIGTNGIPSKYGGFETLVEYLVKFLSNKYEITIFCSSITNPNKISELYGCHLEYINLKANGWQSVLYDSISLYKSIRRFDKILILGASGTIILPLFKKYRDKFVFNFGGLDWQRSKWSFFTRKFLKLSEALGINHSKYIISDNVGIQEYIQKEYNRTSILITYGGDQVFKVSPTNSDFIKYPFLNKNYAFTVARIQHDNNIDLLLESFNEKPQLSLVFVGNWNSSAYGKVTKNKFNNCSNIILIDAIYDKRELNLLRSSCKVYIHGHSAGGTNPALVEAMNLSLPIFAYDCIFNRYTTDFSAKYFSSTNELSNLINSITDLDLKLIGEKMYSIAKKMYRWDEIAYNYAKVFEN